ncbi:4-(cytidine 5'-diphospho)-2-C-methyl-D-erythritol kinase [Sulfitobacter mediterraneus]|uniref:4-(cytidine 5'-diphospho)-2-C-methyl-D-erythritol kinase n=1 Tax=Sulfitobacter mediterraneus TaxID=83219 RepID=UPI0019329060|nr:4-(cytidine 5'-diphospho)-2-C-methyl-D-erythritol kinase [Sulfitobacter mediterraneus]MBM1310578.1 4-(cytidine 5'-diphospho)-2-C-methyl-D-erythritol kinase [Sulfitobacter mediterraneus]MBM1314462.1 4-(cytidine 5'-diphospho)-2-C-methyl-D-erythritol kinase [Sulfitobacter mediterraneus]MBM1322822.1 4-(cytidine 5'-diphospho)-2-C-methyl-D-erythritol kinase [Sulfitobacter mediterraneus]MBM1326734.1 4-(cytidine 5'-diphospho)-2-C-methyl-D-erythritol kinase [Sulfitobacter mediterraneus]MBM1398080.1 
MTSEAFAPAKINLALHVTGQRGDGYHLLDSIVMFADVGDRLWFSSAKDMAISVTGPFADGVPVDRRNLVWQASELAGFCGTIRLEKNLPHGAGIGGGSSDAAAVLRHCGYAGDGAALGADVPVCKAAKAQRMQGIGEVLTPLSGWPALHAVLVNPGVEIATPDVFKALTQKDNPEISADPMDFSTAEEVVAFLQDQRNDLEAPAQSVAPVITSVLTALKALPQCRLARMSGSGATCFALMDTAQDAASAAQTIAAARPEWWVRPCVLS